jgi:hypothetical protein
VESVSTQRFTQMFEWAISIAFMAPLCMI